MLAKDAVRFYYTGDILHISFILGFEIFYIIAIKKNLLGKKTFFQMYILCRDKRARIIAKSSGINLAAFC